MSYPAGPGCPRPRRRPGRRRYRTRSGPLDGAAAALSQFLVAGQALSSRLPDRAHRSASQQAARDALATAMDGARDSFLRVHADCPV